jgi:hypothetical protein
LLLRSVDHIAQVLGSTHVEDLQLHSQRPSRRLAAAAEIDGELKKPITRAVASRGRVFVVDSRGAL